MRARLREFASHASYAAELARNVGAAKAAAYGRVTESINLIAAYLQVKHYIIISECLRRVISPEERERESDVGQAATPSV